MAQVFDPPEFVVLLHNIKCVDQGFLEDDKSETSSLIEFYTDATFSVSFGGFVSGECFSGA